MKLSITRFFLFLFLCLGVASCKKDDTGPDTSPQLKGGGYMPEDKGVKLTYHNSDGTTLLTTVTDVYDSAGYKVASLFNDIPGFTTYVAVSMYNEDQTQIYLYPSSVYYQSLELIGSQEGVQSLAHEEYPIILTLKHHNPVGSVVCGETQFAEYHYLIGEDPQVEIDFTGTNHAGIADSLETITVPAGKFDCLRIRYSNTATFNGAPKAPVIL